MMFHAAGDAVRDAAIYPVPLKSLVNFERVRLAAGETAQIEFGVSDLTFELVDGDGDNVLVAGERSLVFSNGAGQVSTVAWTV